MFLNGCPPPQCRVDLQLSLSAQSPAVSDVGQAPCSGAPTTAPSTTGASSGTPLSAGSAPGSWSSTPTPGPATGSTTWTALTIPATSQPRRQPLGNLQQRRRVKALRNRQQRQRNRVRVPFLTRTNLKRRLRSPLLRPEAEIRVWHVFD